MPGEPEAPKTEAELLAAWRAAGRDIVAAHAAANVAEIALTAAAAAEEAAHEVEEAVERTRDAANRARRAAEQATEVATIALATAAGDKVRAIHDVEAADEVEAGARDAFREAEARASRRVDSSPSGLEPNVTAQSANQPRTSVAWAR